MNTSITQALSAPFDPADVKFKPQAVSGNRCLAIAYISSRTVMDRLDEVLTPAGWQDEYEVLADGSVLCRLRCKLGDEWIMKCDVGSQSEQPDEGDRMKAAFSDALKRAAVKLGCGRYLYRLPSQWVDYDPQRKQIKTPPQLPSWALPGIASNTTAARREPAICAVTPAGSASAGIASNALIHAQDLEDDDPPSVRITDAEEKQLVDLLRDTRADIGRFLAHFKIRAVGQLERKDLPQAVQLLRRKAAAGPGGSAGQPTARNAATNGLDAASGIRKP